MPTGPGDEILDAIKAGKTDDFILAKYKIDSERLKAFKGVHYGLSNQKMNYDEIGDFYPELNSYFQKPRPVAPSKDAAFPLRPTAGDPTASMEYINKALVENDDVVESFIREGRYRQDTERRLNEFAANPRSDNPAAAALAQQRLMLPRDEVKAQDLPVSAEDITQTKTGIQQDEQQARHFLKQVINKKPEQAAQIQKSLYNLDAQQRVEQTPEIVEKVQKNLEKLEKGELKYDPQTGRLIEEEGFFDALVTGVKERGRQMDRYKEYQKDDAEVIKLLENDLASYDPDKPTPVPKGIGEIGQMFGTEWASLLKGGAVAATVGRVAPQATPFITAAVSSPEYYKRGYAAALEQTYGQLRREGKAPEEALKTAQAQARDEGKLSAAEGAISSAVGSRIGLKSLPKVNITNGFKNAAASILKNTTKYAAEQTIEGAADGLVATYLQDQMNEAAKEKGIHRAPDEGLKEAFVGELTFSLALGGITKVASSAVDPKVYKKLMYWLGKQPPETVEAKIGEMVLDGQLSEEDAQEATEKIAAQRKIDAVIPENIKDVSRQAMADKIERRQELEKKIESVDEALHPPLKEEIKKLNEEILEHSTHVKPEDEQAEGAEATEPAPETAVSIDEQVMPGAEETGLEDQTAPGVTPNELYWENPKTGQSFILRGDKLFSVNESGKETEFSDKAMQTPNAKDIVQQIKQSNNIDNSEKPAIETEQDFERELRKALGKDQKMDKLTGGTDNPAADNNADEYYTKAKTVLNKLFPGIQVKVYDNAADYETQEGRPSGSAGVFDPVNNTIAYNLELIKSKGLGNTIFHEAIHPIVNEVIGKNEAALSDLFSTLEDIKDAPGMEDVWRHMNQYYSRGGQIQRVEAITEFFTLAADGKIDTSKLNERTITKIIEFVNKVLQALGVSYQINTANDLKKLSDAITQAFQQQDTAGLEGMLGKPGNEGIAEKMDALAPGASKDDAIKELIKKTPKSVTDEKLVELIASVAEIDEADAQALVDEIRKPPVPPPPAQGIDELSPESRKISIDKFNKLFDKHKEKKPTWFQRQWESLKNASAALDNPYRFVTRIIDDIAKEYRIKDKGAIPLGRVFEKTAAGRAALKVQAFVVEVVNGHIGDKKLGRLKGEKYTDFQKYLAARRVIDRLNTQERLREEGQDVSRQTGNITRQDAEVLLQALEGKYGNLDDFAQRADAFQEHMDFMLKNLVGSGILSQEQYDAIKAENDFYAPFSIVQSKMVSDLESPPVGISGIVKRIKGIDYKIPATKNDALEVLNDLSIALNENLIAPEDYFNSAIQVLQDAVDSGVISEVEYNQEIANLSNPGFALNDILDAAANMLYKAEGMALKNRNMQRLYSYKKYDKDGIFIQDVDGFQPVTSPDGQVRMVAKPLNTIKVEPGMAPIKLRLDGKDKFVAVDKKAAEKLTTYSNYEMATWMKGANFLNRVFRAMVITLSPGFQVVNFVIDFVRTSMLSRYGPFAGKSMTQSLVNAALFMPQYIEALLHSGLGNLGVETDTFKQWMESDSFSKGMFDNLFDNEKRIKEVSTPYARRVLNNFLKLKFIDVPGSILEQTHKLATYQRGLSVEGFKPEMYTAMLGSLFNNSIKPNMSTQELQDASDRLNYEVQNFAGSPNFPQTHSWLKLASIFLQFFSARVKGEMTDYRRIANLFSGKGEGVPLSKQETMQVALQFSSVAGAIAAYAIINNLDDEDEDHFNSIPPYHKDNYLNIPAGMFEYKDQNGDTHILRDYIKVPLRGLTATMNVTANSFVKFYKRRNPMEFKKMAQAFMGNASPINLSGNNERELGESSVSNITPAFKFFIEYSFNRDTHSHRDLIPDTHGKRSMLQKYMNGDLMPWEVKTDKTPKWAIEMSKYLYDDLGVSINPITLDHMENTMGNPTELYDNAIEKRLLRSKMKYPIYIPKGPKEPTGAAEVKPIAE